MWLGAGNGERKEGRKEGRRDGEPSNLELLQLVLRESNLAADLLNVLAAIQRLHVTDVLFVAEGAKMNRPAKIEKEKRNETKGKKSARNRK